jgi:16S rRNA (adenine1518-N6/adenine1519-N6)-dimethyltransferase
MEGADRTVHTSRVAIDTRVAMTRKDAADSRISAKKSLGQHFLVDSAHLAQVVSAAELTPADLVLEIGPGKGVLTQELAARAGGVVAVELDDRLIAPLRNQFSALPHVHIVHGDILELDPPALIDDLCTSSVALQPATRGGQMVYKVVANLPYYITSAVLRHLLEASRRPTRIVVLVQLEVAQRICAEPGDLSLLALSVQYYAQPQLLHRVPAQAFRPVPNVDSAVLRLDVRSAPAVAVPAETFFLVARAGFSQKRKQLLNSLPAGLQRPKVAVLAALEGARIDPTRRAETLTLAEWGELCHTLEMA